MFTETLGAGVGPPRFDWMYLLFLFNTERIVFAFWLHAPVDPKFDLLYPAKVAAKEMVGLHSLPVLGLVLFAFAVFPSETFHLEHALLSPV